MYIMEIVSETKIPTRGNMAGYTKEIRKLIGKRPFILVGSTIIVMSSKNGMM
jgi:hypothetical protein